MNDQEDRDNLVNPGLSKGYIICYKDKFVEVTRVDNEYIYIEYDGSEIEITDDEWRPVFLTDEIMNDFGFRKNQKIKNVRTKKDWVIRQSGIYYYLTIDNDISLGENPIISLHEVHELQRWYFLLTGKNLIFNKAK